MTNNRARTDVHPQRSVLVEAATQHYIQHRTQDQIASALGVSRSQVSRYLKAALDTGVVRITIEESADTHPELEGKIAARFRRLQSVSVVPSDERLPTLTVLSRIATKGAEKLQEIVVAGDTVAVGAGKTLARVVSAMVPNAREGIDVVQAMGNVGHEAHKIDYNAIAQGVANAFDARLFQINSPAILADPFTAQTFLDTQPSIRDAVKKARSANVFAVGVGTVEDDALYIKTGLLSAEELRQVAEAHAVGDICGRFYDASGKSTPTPFDDRIVGIRLRDLRSARDVVAIAAGRRKASAVLGAIRGGYVSHIVIDQLLAEEMMQSI